MKAVLTAPALFIILAALLLCAFFLPDLLGPIVGTAISAAIVLLALLVYQRWCRQDEAAASDDRETPKKKPSA
jgi:Flp pilus assembly protein TadB